MGHSIHSYYCRKHSFKIFIDDCAGCSLTRVWDIEGLVQDVCHVTVLVFILSADEDGWRVEQRDGSEASLEWSSERQDISVISDSYFPRYFIAPGK